MKYLARSVSLTYVPVEDRIRWTSACEGGVFVAVWVARRHLLILLPRLAEWLDKKSPLQQQTVVAEAAKLEIRAFEHQVAQQRIKAVRAPARKQKPDVEFLLNYFGVSVVADGLLELTLVAPDEEIRLGLTGSFAQLHKIVRELLEIGNAAGWGVPDPWQASADSSQATARRTRH
jgi:hypothetical protein